MVVGLFKTIFFILLVYFIFKIIGRFILPLFLRRYVNKVTGHVRQQQEDMLREQKRKKEGEVTVDYAPKPDKTFKKGDGDYVDFEEVK